MNGECKSYRLNDPMAWKEFKSLPDDLKITYIKLLREKYGVSDTQLGKAMGINCCSFSNEMARLGLNVGVGVRNGSTKWDKDGFWAWWNGVDKPSEPTQEEKKQIFFGGTENLPEEKIHWVELESVKAEETEAYVEDDLPFEEPDPRTDEFTPAPVIPVTATPINGSMQFKCPADQALNTLAQILCNSNCAISVMWRMIEEGGAEDAK